MNNTLGMTPIDEINWTGDPNAIPDGWPPNPLDSMVEEVEAGTGIIGDTLRMGEIGPSYLQYLRLTAPADVDMEWAREKVKEVTGDE